MISKFLLYARTVSGMKPIQVVTRAKKMLGFGSSLGVQPAPMPDRIRPFASVKELDFDPVFLSRFQADEFISGRVTFLHESEAFHWHDSWQFKNHSTLWNFNLHYFEYLMPLVQAYESSHDEKYLAAIRDSVEGWIDRNPRSGGGFGWAPYTIALRLVYWFSCAFVLSNELGRPFLDSLFASAYEQYVFLANHLEKDLQANHYFEDLKALILCAIVFRDDRMLRRALAELKKQCKEQILPDGMHFELSPMYHDIILEDLLRIAAALRSIDMPDAEIEGYLPAMLDVSFTFEDGLNRIPLFNDGGNNVAKSLGALLLAGRNHFEILPTGKTQLPDGGYYFFQQGDYRLIVDAGSPGPRCNPGHSHCDAMSFELFRNGEPVLVNCGTYAYQCEDRSFFRSTAAHNTVSVDDSEQSECWSAFRMGRGSKTKVLEADESGIRMELTDQHGQTAVRTICLKDEKLTITDAAQGKQIRAWLHLNNFPEQKISVSGEEITCQHLKQRYSEDYGARKQIDVLEWTAGSRLAVTIDLSE